MASEDYKLKNGNAPYDLSKHKRCGAKKRKSKEKCKQPAMKNGRCKLHGGLSTGAKTPEGKKKSREARLKHGAYTPEWIAEGRAIKAWIRNTRELFDQYEREISGKPPKKKRVQKQVGKQVKKKRNRRKKYLFK